MHFIGKRKPWSGWNPRSFPYFKIVMEILDWAEANYSLPARPLSLQRNQFSKINLRIKKDKIIEYLKRQVKKVIRRKV
jgi:lipopolysaccharide biosynthesis glycosyltransferase